MAETIKFEVSRYRPEEESEPTLQSYDVPYNRDWVVLDALNHVKDQIDGSLSFRWSCRMGVCGSCGMMVNGEPKLTCAVPLTDYEPSKPVRIEPLQFFPVMRDLVVDMTSFLEKLSSVKPWIIRDDVEATEAVEFNQTPAELDAYKQFSMCINCMLCYSACPVVGLEPEFTGPAAIALAQRYNLDSRDEGAEDRMDALDAHEGLWGCTFVGECTKVCPKNVDPAGAIPALQDGERDGLPQVRAAAVGDEVSNAAHEPAAGLKLYRRPMSFWWWLERRVYFKFIVRELTCLFVGAFAILTLLQVRAVGAGPESYAAFAAMLRSPACIAFSVVAFLFVVFHAVTWFPPGADDDRAAHRRAACPEQRHCRGALRRVAGRVGGLWRSSCCEDRWRKEA